MDGDGKREHEAFRVGKFAHDASHPHRHVAHGTEEGSSQECHEVEEEHDVGAPDSSRVILHFDAGDPLHHAYTFPLFVDQKRAFLLLSVHTCTQFSNVSALLHIVDCFYAQVEELRDPSLREKPLGISQKYLVVTCNYPARKAGVTKLMNITEARKKCVRKAFLPVLVCLRACAYVCMCARARLPFPCLYVGR
jgi:hypothetical protein